MRTLDNRLGSGSDYTVFLNRLGIPVADFTFDGPYGVYHSLYDTHRWVATMGIPASGIAPALVQLWGLATMRLANADALPLVHASVCDSHPVVHRRGRAECNEFDRPACDRGSIRRSWSFRQRAAGGGNQLNAARDGVLARRDGPALERLNAAVLLVERQLTDPDGIPNRPWYRHQIYAPQYTYAPEVLPGLTEAVNARDTSAADKPCG